MAEEDDLRERGRAHLEARQYEEAIACFDAALAENPDDAGARCSRGLCWHWLGELENALTDYDEAIRLDPAFAVAYVYRGTVRVQTDDAETALHDYDEALRLEPDLGLAYERRANAHLREGRFREALADLDRALRLAPDNPDLHVSRGFALKELDRADAAMKALDEALRLEPGNAAALQMRAGIHHERGDLDRAGEDLAALHETETEETETMTGKKRNLISGRLREHFPAGAPDELTIVEREFPRHMRADLQRAMDDALADGPSVLHFGGIEQRHEHGGFTLARLIVPAPHDPASTAPPQYEEMDIGEAEPLRCLKTGLWLLEDGGVRFAVLLTPAGHFGHVTGVRIQVATYRDETGANVAREFFAGVEQAVQRSRSYRGKILSLERGEGFHGRSTGLRVHRLRTVAREDVILPERTLELLDRNVLGFARQRTRLAELGLATKKGLLFHGPPGTGKTHTIHYLAHALEGHTTFLVTAEQFGLLGEYVRLARLLQPSVVVLEDVDLIAQDRATSEGCSPVLLHELLNEMDGLRADAEILFLLTTNRPEALEPALRSRPGRIDQAIEFPYPDDAGRAKLVRLYACGLELADELVAATVRRTEGVSAAFIKELLRRAAQFRIERSDGAPAADLDQADVDRALEELLVDGGALNRALLGADPGGADEA